MFGVVVLHESVVWQCVTEERDQRAFQDTAVQVSLHNALEDADFGCAESADAGPNINLQRVLRLRLSFGRLIDLPITCSAKLLEGDRTFIAENNIVECVSSVHHSLGILQPLGFVCVSNQLAVSGILESPSLFFA